MHQFLRAGGVYDGIADAWLPHLERAAKRFEINTPLRQIHWLATLVHESLRLTRLEESLNYSARALLNTWPSRFTPQQAADYARQPERIANHVYANRNGNGDQASGDGWRYRGRGPIQITFHDNYVLASADTGADLVAGPDLLILPAHGASAAGGFWQRNHCNEWADADDITAIRRRVNGGTNGLAEVQMIVDRMKRA